MQRHADRRVGDEQSAPAAAVVTGREIRRWTRGDSARAITALMLLAVVTAMAFTGTSGVESRVFAWFNSLPEWLHEPIWPVMQLGNVAVAVAVGAGIGLMLRRWKVAAVLAAAPLLAWIVAKLIKSWVARGRPGEVLSEVQIRGWVEGGYGFISGHTAVAFALAGVAMVHLRRPWSWLLLALAVLVGIARLYVGAHLPLDVVGGAAAGILIGEGLRFLEVRAARAVDH